MGKTWNNWLLLFAVAALAISPLLIVKEAEFGGADGKAQEMIGKIQPEYKPWFQPIIAPASDEIASLMFALQAALGAGTIGFVVGLYRGRTEVSTKKEDVYSD